MRDPKLLGIENSFSALIFAILFKVPSHSLANIEIPVVLGLDNESRFYTFFFKTESAINSGGF